MWVLWYHLGCREDRSSCGFFQLNPVGPRYLLWKRKCHFNFLQGSAITFALGCLNPASLFPLAAGDEFMQPRVHFLAEPCSTQWSNKIPTQGPRHCVQSKIQLKSALNRFMFSMTESQGNCGIMTRMQTTHNEPIALGKKPFQQPLWECTFYPQ